MKIGILWDLDGTLLDTLQDLADGTNYALRQFGYPERSLEEVRRFVGNGAGRLIARAVPEGADARPVLEAFFTFYNAHCQIQTRPYPGILDALAELGQRYPMAVISNKPDAAVKQLCRRYFPGLYALGEQPGCPRKPAPDMVYRGMAAIGVETCIYVGDSEVDVATAHNAGVPCLSVLWGFRNRGTLAAAGAEHWCESCQALPEMIDKIAGEINGK